MKKVLVIFLLAAELLTAATVYDDLIGKKETDLDGNMFQCRFHSCQTEEKLYFNNPLIDKTVRMIETRSDENGEIYQVFLYIVHVEEFENSDISDAFFNAIKHHGEANGKHFEYSLEFISDKYGNKSIVKIIDPKRRDAYMKRLEANYIKALDSYSKK